MDPFSRLQEVEAFLNKGGIAIWAIALLSVLTLALIMWKIWRLSLMGAWSSRKTEQAVELWSQGDVNGAKRTLQGRRSLRAVVARSAIETQTNGQFSEEDSKEEVIRVAKLQLQKARSGLRPLELISTIAPLLGLLGTVLGMIAAFQALQEAGSRADPAALAGGIWEALLTTAAGMAVAIPASMALTWFESIVDRLQSDMEDSVTRIQTRRAQTVPMLSAAE